MKRWLLSSLNLALILSLWPLGSVAEAGSGWWYYNQSDYRVKVRYKVIVSRHKLRSTRRYRADPKGWTTIHLNPGQSHHIRSRYGNWRGKSWGTFVSTFTGDLAWVSRSGKNYYIKNNPNLYRKFRDSFLFSEATNGELINVKGALKNGANVNARTKAGDTALLVAAQKGRTDIVRFLLKRDAEIKVKNRKGYTALKYAEKKGFRKIARMLRRAARRIGY